MTTSRRPTSPRPLSKLLATAGAVLAATLFGCIAVEGGTLLIDLPNQPYPTGIDHWPAKRMIVFGDLGGRIYSIGEDGSQATKLMDIGEIDCARVARVRVDEARKRLWIMGASGICVYDLGSLQLIRNLPLGDMSRSLLANPLTDIALDRQGNAYAIDTGMDPIVYRVDSATLSGAAWNKATAPGPVDVYTPRHYPLNAIAVTPQGGHVMYVDAYSGKLHVMDTAGGKHSTVSTPHTLFAVSGLVAAPAGAVGGAIDVYALSASRNSITVLGVDGSLKTARARAYATKYLDHPLAGTMAGSSLFVTNSPLSRHAEVSGHRDGSRPSSIARLTSKYFAEQAANPVMDGVLGP